MYGGLIMSQSVWIEQPCPSQTKRTYYYDNGAYLTKEGGTVAWRNNNEGNLRPGSLSSNRIGVDKNNFAVFGREAQPTFPSHGLMRGATLPL